MTRPFTGRHMLGVMVLFFGVVIAVNLMMARLAVSTFGGTVVDNSYVASQKFNGWMAAGRKQAELGWRVAVGRDAQRRVTLALSGNDRDLRGATITALAVHPFGHRDQRLLRFVPTANGYRSDVPLAEGRWRLKVAVRHAGQQASFLRDLP